MTPYGGAFGDGDIFSIGTNGMGFDDLVDFTGTGGEILVRIPKAI